MSIRYIFGMAGSGKTKACVSELLAAAEQDSERSVIYIVPEQFSLQSERIILQNVKAASMKIQVLSFLRLSYWVLSKTGHQSRSVLDDVGKHMLLQAVLQKIENELTLYKPARQLPGFLDMLARQITEFYQYGLTPELLELRASALSDDVQSQKSLKIKLTELSRIYRSYAALKDTSLISNDETLDILAGRINSCSFLYGAEIWVDGFHGFTVQEHRVLTELMQVAGQITFAFTVPSGDFIKSSALLEGPFAGIQQAILTLNKNAETYSVSPGVNRYIQPSPEQDGRMNDLKYLRDRFFDFPAIPFRHSDRAVRIYEAQSRIDEVRHTASKILELARERGFSFSDIGVAACDLEEYHKLIKTVFPQYGIPCFIDRNRDIMSHPLTEMILSAIDCVIKGRRYDEIFRLFRTGLTTLTQQETDKLENYVLAYGIRGNRWDSPFTLGFSSANAEFSEPEINALREKAVSIFSIIEKHFKKRAAAVSSYAGGVVHMLRELLVPEKLDGWISDSYESDMEKFREHRQIWGKVTHVFDRMVSMLGADSVIGIRAFRDLLSAGFEGTSMGLIPPGLDQVVVTDLRRSRLPGIKALFVLGVNEGSMPQASRDDGLISGAERDTLKQSLDITLAPSGVSLTYESFLQFYLAITKPTSFLGVSYYLGGLDGKSGASSVIQTFKAMFPDSPVEKTSGDPLAAVSAEAPAFSYLAGKLSQINDYGISPFDKDVYSYFKNSGTYGAKLSKLYSAISDRGGDVRRLSGKNISEIYKKNLRTSVSRLEKYVSCPFSYFARYNLRAGERSLYELQSVDVGNVFHEVMDRFAKKLGEQNIDWASLNRDELLKIAGECVAESTAGAASEILKSSGRYKSLAARIGDISTSALAALTKHIRRGEFSFYSSEFEFKGTEHGGNAIVLTVEEGFDIIIEGKIDRIDLLLQNGVTYVKIIDYKSGSVHFSFSRLFFGLQLQLLLYLDAFIGQMSAGGVDARPAAALYFRIANPTADHGEIGDKPVADVILKQFKMEGVVLKERGVYSALDLPLRESGGTSPVVPGGLLGGKNFDYESADFRKSPYLLTSGEFSAASAFANEKVREIGKKIKSGDVTARPYKDKSMTACDYCEYKPICRFDRLLDREGFNQPYVGAKEAENIIKGSANY